MAPQEPPILLEGITFGYSEAERTLLEGLSLTVRSGEFAAILGPSGVGKSTLLNLVAGLLVPQSGRIRILGTAVDRLSEAEGARWRSRQLGFIFQQFHLLPYLTVEENVALPLVLNGQGPDSGQVRGLLARLGLLELGGSYPRQLSSGQAQRTAIARALVHRPPVLLADEVTGNLDEEAASGVLELLTESVEASGTTTLVVTHSPVVATQAHVRYRLSQRCLHLEP